MTSFAEKVKEICGTGKDRRGENVETRLDIIVADDEGAQAYLCYKCIANGPQELIETACDSADRLREQAETIIEVASRIRDAGAFPPFRGLRIIEPLARAICEEGKRKGW